MAPKKGAAAAAKARGGGGGGARGGAKASAASKRGAVEAPRTQRKIYHALESSGSGDHFCYYNKFSRKSRFVEGETVYVTEKWDGTTVQATNTAVFKRLDQFKKGDPRKHTASEQERYRLEQLDLDSSQNKYIASAVERYRETFARLPSGVCVYFEAIGSHIGPRFRHLDETFYDIRVFDFARDGVFLSFDDTIALAGEYDLPLVHYEEIENVTVAALVERLSGARSYHDIEAPLEGFVLRDITDQGRIAKIRVEDLAKLAEAHY